MREIDSIRPNPLMKQQYLAVIIKCLLFVHYISLMHISVHYYFVYFI